MAKKKQATGPKPVTAAQYKALAKDLLGTRIYADRMFKGRFKRDITDADWEALKVAGVQQCSECNVWQSAEEGFIATVTSICKGCMDEIDARNETDDNVPDDLLEDD